MNELFLVRHGECQANIDKRITGVKESPLTERGLQQAHDLGRFALGKDINGVVSSTIGRASKTADILGAYLDVPVVAIPHFRAHSFGILEGYTLQEAKDNGLGKYLHKPETDKYTHYVPDGETAMEVQARVAPAFKVLRSSNFNLALVLHNSVVRGIAGDVYKLESGDWVSMTVPNGNLLRLGETGLEEVSSSHQTPDDLMDLYRMFKEEGMYRTRSRIARLMSIKYPGTEEVQEHMIADGYFADAIESTRELLKIRDDVQQYILPQNGIIGLVYYGSSAHSPYYAVKRDSDLDFDIVVKDGEMKLEDAPIFADVKDRLVQTLSSANKAGADICSFKFDYKGHPISMRITKEHVFKKVCTNNPNSTVPSFIKEFRDNPKPLGSYYQGRYSFDGEEHSWFPRIHEVEGGVVSLNPVSRIDNRGRYVNGVTTDKYLSQPIVEGDINFLTKYLFQATTEVVRRLIQEEHDGITARGSIVNLMARHDTMPKHQKQSMVLKEQIIREMIKRGVV